MGARCSQWAEDILQREYLDGGVHTHTHTPMRTHTHDQTQKQHHCLFTGICGGINQNSVTTYCLKTSYRIQLFTKALGSSLIIMKPL